MNNIINELNSKIKAISIIINQNSLDDITKEIVSKEDKDDILESLLNYYLEKLKPIYNKDTIDSKYSLITEITDYFIDDEDDIILEEGSTLVYDFLAKLTSKNNRNLTLPINLSYLKEYAINNNIDKDNAIKEIVWMIILLATIYYCIPEKANN